MIFFICTVVPFPGCDSTVTSSMNASINVRFACGNANVIDNEPCGEVVAAVHDDVVVLEDVEDVVGA